MQTTFETCVFFSFKTIYLNWVRENHCIRNMWLTKADDVLQWTDKRPSEGKSDFICSKKKLTSCLSDKHDKCYYLMAKVCDDGLHTVERPGLMDRNCPENTKTNRHKHSTSQNFLLIDVEQCNCTGKPLSLYQAFSF